MNAEAARAFSMIGFDAHSPAASIGSWQIGRVDKLIGACRADRWQHVTV